MPSLQALYFCRTAEGIISASLRARRFHSRAAARDLSSLPVGRHVRRRLRGRGLAALGRAALARVQYYVWESEKIATYFETRNGMLGGDYSSKLAPWLAS